MPVTIGPGWSIGEGWSIGGPPPPPSNGSIQLDGTNYLTVPNNTAFDQNSGAWTVECFVYPTDSQQGYVYMQNTSGFLGIVYGNNKFMIDQSQIGFQINSPTNYPINNWYHVAMTLNFSSGVIQLWIDGLSQGTWASSGLITSGATTQIGSYVSGNEPFRGHISNLRVVKGVAVYTGAFTPPTAPLTTTQGAGTNISAITGTQTQLLLNTYQGAGFLTDASTNNFTVTNIGIVTSSALNPF